MDLCLSNIWLPLSLSALTLLIIFLYIIATRSNDFFKKRSIPFKKPLPFLGNLGPFLLRKRSLGEMQSDIYQTYESSSVAGYFEFLSPVFMIHDPELFKKICVKDFDYFTDRRDFIKRDSDPLFGRTLFLLQGKKWRDVRHTLSPAFTSSKMKAMFILIAECGQQMADHLENKLKESNDGLLTLEMKELFSRYANDVITTSAFGVHCDSLAEPNNDFIKAGKLLTSLGGRNGMVILGYMIAAKLMKLFRITFMSSFTTKFFRTVLEGNIEMRRREGIVRHDMLHLLMQAQKGTLKVDVTDQVTSGHKNNKEPMSELTDDDLVAQAVLFYFGGFDTVSTLLCFLTHQLALHPDIQKRLQTEIDDVLNEDGNKITYAGVQRMKYMDTVISETLRIFPPAIFVDRLCVKSYTIPATATNPEIKLKPGDEIMYPVFGIQRNAKYWPEPMKFNPDRFNDDNKHKIVPFSHIPFGDGPRACIGMRFALMEAKIAVTSLLSRFDLQVVSKTVTDVTLEKGSFTINKEGGFWLGLKPRGHKLQ